MIPYGRQHIDEDDIRAVTETLASSWLTQGPAVPGFEASMARYTGSEFAVAATNATAALHLACLALEVGPGDTVWTSPISFVASANCARYCGADVDFVDIDPATFNMCPASLADQLRQAERDSKLPKVVIPVHMGGQSCDMQSIHKLSRQYGFRIIEDASHAVGGDYQGRKIGNNRYSDITIFSFHPVKIITTGEGGMALTDNPELAERMRRLRSHGIQSSEELTVETGRWAYEQVDLGFNYRMTDLQAALGSSQLKKLDSFIARRRELAANYDERLTSMGINYQRPLPDGYSAYHLYIIQLPETARRRIYDGLRQAQIFTQIHYIPIHTQPYYQTLGFNWGDYPNAETYYAKAISLPMFPDLQKTQQEFILNTLADLL